MQIVSLKIENIKYLKVVKIKPDGSVVVIGGDNAAGKTCVLDSIEYALNGAGAVPSRPIRTGQKKARVVLDLGDILVTRTFTEKGTNLTVKNKDGATFASPQAMLDKFVGALTFDPLEFSRMDSKKQTEVLKQLVGLDFNKIDIQYKKLFDERTIINRRGKDLKANLKATTHHHDIPDKEISIKELGDKYAEAIEHNKKAEDILDALDAESDELAKLEKRIAVLKKSIAERKQILEEMPEIDVESMRAEIAQAENINVKIRENQKYTQMENELEKLRQQSMSLSSKMAELIDSKTMSLAQADFPIDGLSIENDCVMFDGIPFDQCSTAQKIKVSVAMGLAMNPKLRILLIREGSLLDEKSLALIGEMAQQADAQVWMERVSKGDECQVIIEDGSIKQENNKK